MAEVLYKPSTSDARSSSSSRYHRSRQPRMTATLPAVTLTGKVVRRTTRVLLESEGFHQEHVLALISFEENEPEVWQKVEKVADNIKRLIADLKKAKKVPTCIDYEQLHWVVHDGNIHSEFKRVTEEMFKDGVHWGKIVALLSFTTNYTLYAIRQGMDGSIVESVCGWTVIFMERELGDWFQEHSWVSRICTHYL